MKKLKEIVKKFFESKKVFVILSVFGVLVVASLIFQAGIFIGFHKASFGRDWGENYGRNFGMMRGDRDSFRGGMMNLGNFPNSNGAVGKIIKIELPTMLVQDKDGTEKIVLIKDDTSVRSMMNEVTKNDLKVDDFVVVVGSPNNQGQIEAKLIRLMPAGIPDYTTQTPAPKSIQ